ncbi:MAG: inositol monophosphatase family protein [Pseudomonadota bacterium]
MTLVPDFDAVSIALTMADAGRTATLPHFRNLSNIDNKEEQGFDPVTEADRAGERAIRAVLADLRPDDGINGEEYGVQEGTSGWTWFLDPVDGTRAFVAGLPVWTTLIGLVDANGDAVVGIIDQPVLDERYIGSPSGAVLQSRGTETQIKVSACDDLRQAIIATTDPFILTPAEQGAWTHLRHTAKLVRYGLDAYAYARVAAGTIDLVAEAGLAPHDTAALIPIVRAAGGLACDWRGNPAKPGGQIVCAANANLLDQALISLRRSAD